MILKLHTTPLLLSSLTVVDFFPLQDIQKWSYSRKDFLIYLWIASVPRGSSLGLLYVVLQLQLFSLGLLFNNKLVRVARHGNS
jgi:hypothetical protein